MTGAAAAMAARTDRVPWKHPGDVPPGSKICNDLRLLSSGPQAGLGEINLPARQAGSSIMPGKVNPVIPEAVNQIAFEVIGNDVTVTLAAEGGQLQLNAFEPVIHRSLSAGLDHLTAGIKVLTEHCVRGITANRNRLAETVAASTGLVTALSPALGYETAYALALEAHHGTYAVWSAETFPTARVRAVCPSPTT